jgi:hypothetical protein
MVIVDLDGYLVVFGLGNPIGRWAKAIALLSIDQSEAINLAWIHCSSLNQRVLVTVEGQKSLHRRMTASGQHDASPWLQASQPNGSP